MKYKVEIPPLSQAPRLEQELRNAGYSREALDEHRQNSELIKKAKVNLEKCPIRNGQCAKDEK
jgi:hypothetical protein